MENFNPRSREGSDIMRMSMVATSTKFQSTLPRGERRYTGLPALPAAADFNPRSREGSDGFRQNNSVCPENFNPRSREGSDYTLVNRFGCSSISIHAPARGATTACHASKKFSLFQSTLPRGERLHLLTFFRLQYGYILFHLTNKYSFCF